MSDKNFRVEVKINGRWEPHVTDYGKTGSQIYGSARDAVDGLKERKKNGGHLRFNDMRVRDTSIGVVYED